MRWTGFVVGSLVVLGTWASVVATLVVPRGLTSRLSAAIGRSVRAALLLLVRRVHGYEARDRVLVFQGPLVLLVQLLAWIGLFFVGYALMLIPFTAAPLGSVFRETASSMLTLGFAASGGAGASAVDFAASGTGLIVIALQIAYLPTLYAAFNRRETLVTLLQSRAGAPAWGPEILARHNAVGLVANLPALYAEWERWSADVAESHTTYPILLDFRSPDPLRSWIVGLLAVLDSAALYLSLAPVGAPAEARLFLRMGFTALRDIATVLRIPFDADPLPGDPIALTEAEFLEGVERLKASNFPVQVPAEEAWPHFHGWRVNYESLAYALADRLVAPPSLWSGPRTLVPGPPIPPGRPVDRRPGTPAAERR